MMDQTVGYSRKDLESVFSAMGSRIANMELYIQMMEEQGKGKRDNLDWVSAAWNLRTDFENIKRHLNSFGIIAFPADPFAP